MSDYEEVQQLIMRFTDAVNSLDILQFEATWTPEATWIIDSPTDYRSSGSRREIAEAFEAAMKAGWATFVQLGNGALIDLSGDVGTATCYVTERGISADGEAGYFNHGVYHDRLERTPEGWRFRERHYRYLYLENAPLPGTGAPLGGARSREAGHHDAR